MFGRCSQTSHPPKILSPCIRLWIIQLKALWGGHTAALQFMLCIQLPIGEGKHAIRSRRLHEDEIVTACTAGNSTEMVLICLYVGLPKHVLHELSLLKYRVRRAFLHKMRPDAMRKSRNVTFKPREKVEDAKYSLPEGAINKRNIWRQRKQINGNILLVFKIVHHDLY